MNLLRLKSKLLIALIGVFFALNPLSLAAQALNYKGPFTVVKRIYSRVCLIADANGTLFILKAHDNPENALREIIGSTIGESVVNINAVQIIPHSIDLKEINLQSNLTYTLHTYINGEHYEGNLIFQAISNKYHLKNIAYYDHSLAQIAAFNLFINNWDCHQQNLLRNKETNQFTVIDMDHAFFDNYSRSLATTTQDYLKTLKKRKLSLEKINGLKNFNETLNHLISLYPPDKFNDLWIQQADKLNCSYNTAQMNDLAKNFYYHFNEIKKVHCCINYLTAKPTFIENISNNVLDASFYSFKALNEVSKNTLYMGILGASDISCKILKIAFNEADKLNKNIVKLQKKLHKRVVL